MRCADCVRRVPSTNDGGYCLLLRRAVAEEWFCADFEKRGKGPIAVRLRKMADSWETLANDILAKTLNGEFTHEDARKWADRAAELQQGVE